MALGSNPARIENGRIKKMLLTFVIVYLEIKILKLTLIL